MNNTEEAVKPGSHAPDFCLRDPRTQNEICLRAFEGRNILLVFFRGTWCPFCREQMRVLSANHSRLERANIATVGVICQSAVSVHRYLEANPLPFPLLPDETRAVAKRYGVHYWLSLEGMNLARPAMFIIDTDGTVTFRHIGRNMADLPIGVVLEKFLGFLAA